MQYSSLQLYTSTDIVPIDYSTSLQPLRVNFTPGSSQLDIDLPSICDGWKRIYLQFTMDKPPYHNRDIFNIIKEILIYDTYGQLLSRLDGIFLRAWFELTEQKYLCDIIDKGKFTLVIDALFTGELPKGHLSIIFNTDTVQYRNKSKFSPETIEKMLESSILHQVGYKIAKFSTEPDQIPQFCVGGVQIDGMGIMLQDDSRDRAFMQVINHTHNAQSGYTDIDISHINGLFTAILIVTTNNGIVTDDYIDSEITMNGINGRRFPCRYTREIHPHLYGMHSTDFPVHVLGISEGITDARGALNLSRLDNFRINIQCRRDCTVNLYLLGINTMMHQNRTTVVRFTY